MDRQMAVRVWEAGLVLLAVFGRLTGADPVRVPSAPVCPVKSVTDSIVRFPDSSCLRFGDESVLYIDAVGVTEGDEVSLQRALSLVHKNSQDYVALLFYASWCPFSGTFRSTLSILSFLYPSIPHFAIEESVIRPSTLSKYGVHGFPTLFLLNSTMRIRYHGSGDEVSLQRALSLVHKNSQDYVALLFYASWCPFSGTFRSTLSILSFLYPSIPHFAIEESVIRPSTLSKYGVHGFPTLFLLNSTMRIRYHGSRTHGSLVLFYSEVTGLKPAPLDLASVERIVEGSSDHEEYNNGEQEICPFSWARSPENLFRQETYLALATAFVILRLLYFIFPTLFAFGQIAWRRYILNMSLRSWFEHPLAYMNREIQLFNSLREPRKRSNLQEGALNAKAWASKSLASVSFGDASTSRAGPVS
ncbi:5'-adenylylsulfate reductase-like [Actinidia chinensis var. chinensis]|uniref:5'-adenylylsulfate reductase-like n=1 Tax=Actinidia chinensis var. chinensis TaxID=1590841 RepID=A0A2R6QYG9_ACTCC|nr:5'-adenylylsulfate reductase-like [Actinidia chinensis var. chinensis]